MYVRTITAFSLFHAVTSFGLQSRPTRSSAARSSVSKKGITKQTVTCALGNPFDMMKSYVSGKATVPASFKATAPTWDELESMLASQQTKEERELPALRAAGYGPASCGATLRLFDAPADYEPRVVLYRDHAGWCPYCAKVWLQLEEKKIPYRIVHVPMSCYGQKPESFRLISRSGAIPVVTIDGVIISESNDIMAALEKTFPDNNPLLPKGPKAALVGPLLRLERELFSCWFRWLTSGNNDGGQRTQFCSILDRVDKALADMGGPYFLGEEFSNVDIMYASFLERMAASLPYYKALVIRGTGRWPHVEKWFSAMESRQSYKYVKGDYYTHCHDLPPQIGGCVSSSDSEVYAAEIDGTDGVSWALPLKKEGGLEATIGMEEGAARREAVTRLLLNHERLTKFACRAVAGPGMPPVGAPLADPNAKPNLKFEPPVDAAFRHIAHAMLTDTSVVLDGGLSPGQPAEQVKLCVEYVMNRVGVPRDMTFDAARQFRAYMYWYITAALPAVPQA